MARSLRGAPPPAPRAALWTALVLALAGLVLAGMLVRIHAQAHAGISSFCDISETVSCDKVALSRYSVVLGVPVAAWGVLGYAAAAGLAAWGLLSRRPHPGWPAGLLVLLGLLATAAGLVLAVISSVLIGAWCLLCVGSWVASAGVLGAGWAACRPRGPAAALRADLAALRSAPRLTAAVLVVSLALVGGLAAAWPPAEGPPVRPATAATPPVTPPGGTLEVVVFSDYECPFCAQEHARLKTLLAGRSDVRVSHRHFPLDQSCNRLIKRPMHQSACQRARAAVCAEAQGRLEQMDDALFADQREGLDVVGLAGRLGLDLDRFRDCLGSPEAAARVAADVEAGMTVGVRATPTYVIGGVAYPGQFPVALLPPTAAR